MVDERCTEHYSTRCRETAQAGRSRLVEWLAWMEVEIDNIRVVLRRCIAGRGLVTWAPHRGVSGLVLDDPRDQRGNRLAR